MIDFPFIAGVGHMFGDPTRASMLAALKHDAALSAAELTSIAGVAPSTASGHLAMLVEKGLVTFRQVGRHRYYRLSRSEVADALEALETLAVAAAPPNRLQPPTDRSVCFARTCYDHLAGTLGVDITWSWVASRYLRSVRGGFGLTKKGERELERLCIDPMSLKKSPRQLTRSCADWTEERTHLGGALGAALYQRFCDLGWLKPKRNSRAVELTSHGRRELVKRYNIKS